MGTTTLGFANWQRTAALLLAVSAASCGGLGEIQGRVVSSGSGQPVKCDQPLVVIAVPAADAPAPALRTSVMRRVGGAFETPLLVAPVGRIVRFENFDDIYHRFFSSSLPNAFDLGMLEPGTAKTQRFEHAGPVHVYCSLHAEKQATILVVPTTHFTLVGPTGEFRLPELKPGEYRLETWADGVPPGRLELTVPSGETFVDIPVHELPVQGTG